MLVPNRKKHCIHVCVCGSPGDSAAVEKGGRAGAARDGGRARAAAAAAPVVRVHARHRPAPARGAKYPHMPPHPVSVVRSVSVRKFIWRGRTFRFVFVRYVLRVRTFRFAFVRFDLSVCTFACFTFCGMVIVHFW